MSANATVDRAVTVLAAMAAPLLPLLVRHQVISTADAQDVGAVILAAVGAYHGGAAVQRRATGTVAPTQTPTGTANVAPTPSHDPLAVS